MWLRLLIIAPVLTGFPVSLKKKEGNKMVDEILLNKKKANKQILKGVGTGFLSLAVLFSEAAMASGFKLSNLSRGWLDEAGEVVPAILMIVAGIGVIIASIAVISGVMAKKNQEPLKWQLWGVIGGALAVIVPVLILATAGSVGSGQGNASGTLNQLNIKY